MKRREKLKDILELLDLYQEKQDTIHLLSVVIADKLKASEDRLTNKLSVCNDRLNKFLDEEIDEYTISLTKAELANIINILCSHIYSHEENQIQDIIQIKDKLKEVLENKNEQINQ